jgi:hypothetical protein
LLERPDHLLELRCRRLERQVDERGLGLGSRDPHQRPHLGVAELATGETSPDDRQRFDAAGHPHLIAGGAQCDPATPGEPVGARVDAGRCPAFPAVELGDERQPPTGGGCDMPGERADLLAQLFEVVSQNGHEMHRRTRV